MKKILHISKYYYPYVGGTEQIARDCVLALKDSYEQKVVSFSEDRKDKKIEVDEIEVFKCGCFMKIASQSLSFSYKRILNKVIHEFEPDIIIFHYPNPFVASILLKIIKKLNIKLILYWHLDIIKQKLLKKLFVVQNRNLLQKAVKVIATSPNYIEGSEWLNLFKHKCTVIPNCINVERMKLTTEENKRATEIKKENKGKILCLAVGRHTEYKGFKYLIQASNMLSTKYKFFITGTGELTRKLHKEAAGNAKVKFTGRISDNELKALMLACDIFCFPSITKNEAFGLALAEAMYYEKPVVTFTIQGSGVNYVSRDKETGIEVENRNVKKFAEAIKKLGEDTELRNEYGKAGKKRVETNFLSTQYYNNIRRLLEFL